ncbi:DUF433 domain-containing protein [Pedobacter alpinus]|uniref:DUF433 domain-containing protein n=1 Tax=Pedobacter alpinus TaxID=1590643 RepID=A0ABW5TW85_9SPHI
MTTQTHQSLGEGIYTIPDVAFLLKLPQAKVRRWMTEFWDTQLGEKHQHQYSWGEGREKATNFHTLIEFYVFYQLRELNVSTKKILIAHEDMANQMHTPYPFAHAELLTDGKSILFELSDGVVIKADRTQQIAFKEIIENFCKKIAFSSDKVAEKFYPMGLDNHIIVDPRHQFGQPIISNTNILAETVYNLYDAGEDIDFIARLYKLSESEVEDAIALFTKTAA